MKTISSMSEIALTFLAAGRNRFSEREREADREESERKRRIIRGIRTSSGKEREMARKLLLNKKALAEGRNSRWWKEIAQERESGIGRWR